ncbi:MULTISPECIES: LytTR family DNA-binding domain-containing protein [Aerococcus]|uniref:LytTR family transcriptional regulator n=1 Tax=Aerococcus sanguinicola TaxID=119206 RepID=A0A5N1GPC6_9LACT|nr:MULTISPECIES: LytTR family DNA-binding domain-containing protein [Aerococcus]KAA9300560.1 LytTR family transcriptional regulator [Aerococcus sanguinicola]MDK6369642.1 LytTR family DNA-binding domain-containing protein [Aerococcus sp. UMB9870]MDK6680147.1 LytTR family DNA-binding domain-containing protein [Aerococcus sp. UMB8608]MDK6686308.1 LytTR family DNA-binding domain-containing protein [Aerococcus sp. UMB8623]MDK6940228.1 LytTR family DNA-binding domain-containing protein [Aerococcus s
MPKEKLIIQRILDQDESSHQVILRANDSKWLDHTADLLYRFEGKRPADRLTIKTQDSYQVLTIQDIFYAEINQGQLTIWTKDKSYTCRLSLKKMESLLPEEDYLRASRYSLVRLDAIQSLELAFSGNMYARLSNQKKILISRRFLHQFKERLGL